MKKGIVITTSFHTRAWLPECVDSLPKGYDVLIVSNNDRGIDPAGYPNAKIVVNDWNGFELGGIARGAEHFDEFIHLMDTCVVKDPTVFEKMFAHDGSAAFSLGFYHYLGKYKTDILKKVGIPKIDNKEDAIKNEHHWHLEYFKHDPRAAILEPFLPITSDVFEEKHGRKNMVVENQFIKKFKATHR